DRIDRPDPGRFAAAATVDLRLHHPNGPAQPPRQLSGHDLGLQGRIGDAAARHRDAVGLQELLRLILVNVHWDPPRCRPLERPRTERPSGPSHRATGTPWAMPLRGKTRRNGSEPLPTSTLSGRV